MKAHYDIGNGTIQIWLPLAGQLADYLKTQAHAQAAQEDVIRPQLQAQNAPTFGLILNVGALCGIPLLW